MAFNGPEIKLVADEGPDTSSSNDSAGCFAGSAAEMAG